MQIPYFLNNCKLQLMLLNEKVVTSENNLGPEITATFVEKVSDKLENRI